MSEKQRYCSDFKAICKYQGFQIVIPYPQSEEQLSIFIENEGKYRITLGKEGGYVRKIDNFLNKLENYKQSLIKEQAKLETKLSAAASALNNMNSYSEQIQSLQQELIKLDKHFR